jgi:hypothetical protein
MTDLEEQIHWLAIAPDQVSRIEVYGPMTFHEARMRHNNLVRISPPGTRISQPFRAPNGETAEANAVRFLPP